MADITIDNLPVAISLNGTEFVAISKNTGSGYETEKTTTGAISDISIQASYVLATANISLPFARILASTSTHITITDAGAGGAITLDLANSGVTAATYGDATHIPQIAVDAKGRVTSATLIDISSPSFTQITLNGSTSGSTVLKPIAIASGTLTLPAATDTLIGKATTDTLTNKTFDTAAAGNVLKISGVSITSTSGTGSVALTTSPAFTTPNIGAASGVSLNLSGLTISSAVATDASKNLVSVANTGTGNNVLATSATLVTPVLGAATGTSLNLSGLTASNAVATDASKNLVSVANTGSGSNVLATSPTLVTPTIGAATGTSLNLSGLTASNAVATDGSKNLVSVANTGSGNNVLAVSPALTGLPTAPTQTQADNSTKLATTAYVDTGLSGVQVAPRNIVPFLASTTWTAPANVTRVRAQVWAGGGGGGGAGDTTNTVAGAPGAGSGEYREGTFTVVPGTVYTITIGAAGAAGSSAPANGGSGGNSIFDVFCTAIGGSGSTAVLNSIVGTIPPGGTGGSGGQIALAGSPGNQALLYGAATVGGGIGGSPAFGRGINSPSLNGTGAAGLFPGGGGTGGSSVTNGVGNAGGAGAAGYIILSY